MTQNRRISWKFDWTEFEAVILTLIQAKNRTNAFSIESLLSGSSFSRKIPSEQLPATNFSKVKQLYTCQLRLYTCIQELIKDIKRPEGIAASARPTQCSHGSETVARKFDPF